MNTSSENKGPSNDPLVSVCLMTYNRAHYLRGVLDSWLAQTYTNFELIISDDASSDGTEALCREYAAKDKRIRYYRQQKNLNCPGCYTFIINQARGEYFIWASDDDLWDKRFLEECIAVYRKRPELALVFADMVDIDKDGKEFKSLDHRKYLPLAPGLYDRLKQHMLFYFDDGKLQLLFGLWKRTAVIRHPLFGPHEKDDHFPYYWGCDNYVVFRSLTNGPAGFVPQKLFFRRSRVLEEYRPPRPIVPRLYFTFIHRLEKIFVSPFFWYVIRHIVTVQELSLWEKAKLLFWNFFVMARIFFVRKV